jgi:hypothetical protein
VLNTRDQAIVLERERGDAFARIGGRHGITHQRASLVMRKATEFVNRVDLDLMTTRKTGEVVGLVIPFGESYSLALDFSDWLLRRLRARGVTLDVETRRTTNGLVLFLTDSTPRGIS